MNRRTMCSTTIGISLTPINGMKLVSLGTPVGVSGVSWCIMDPPEHTSPTTCWFNRFRKKKARCRVWPFHHQWRISNKMDVLWSVNACMTMPFGLNISNWLDHDTYAAEHALTEIHINVWRIYGTVDQLCIEPCRFNPLKAMLFVIILPNNGLQIQRMKNIESLWTTNQLWFMIVNSDDLRIGNT